MTVPTLVSADRLARGASSAIRQAMRTGVPEVAPAAVVVIRLRGETVFEMAAGSIDLDPGEGQVTTRTRFDLASLTKLCTASACLRLVGEGRMGLDEAAASVIPELAEGGPRGMDGGQEPLTRRLLPTPADRCGRMVDAGRVTFRQLLSHTSGLAPWRALFQVMGPVPPPGGPDPRDRAARWATGLAAICRSPFVTEPGAEVRYSDLGFMLLGEAVARLTGSPLDVALRDRVWRPLGLASMTFLPLQAGCVRADIAPSSIDDDWRHRRLWGEVEDENAAGLGGIAGHAGLFAPADDVARLGQAWLEGGKRLGIAPELAREATRDQTPGLGEARGLGWQVQPTDHLAPLGPRAFGHTGFTGTSLAVDPDRGLVVALLTNRVYAGRRHPGIDELRLAIHEAAATAA